MPQNREMRTSISRQSRKFTATWREPQTRTRARTPVRAGHDVFWQASNGQEKLEVPELWSPLGRSISHLRFSAGVRKHLSSRTQDQLVMIAKHSAGYVQKKRPRSQMRRSDATSSTLVWERIAEMLGRPSVSAVVAAAATLARLPHCDARRARDVVMRLPLRCGWRWRGKISGWPLPLQIDDVLSAKADGRQLCMLEKPPLLPDKPGNTAAGTCMMGSLEPAGTAHNQIRLACERMHTGQHILSPVNATSVCMLCR